MITDSLPPDAEVGQMVDYLGAPREVVEVRRRPLSVSYTLRFGKGTVDVTKLLPAA